MPSTAVRRRDSTVQHLTVALWLNHDPRQCWMGGFIAYFDASGHPDDRGGTMFVSGFVASEAKWLKFEGRWLDLLRRYGVESPFHMKDFTAGVKQYAAWKDERIALVFEDGDKHKGKLLDAIADLKVVTPNFRSKEAFVPFQAADILAWEHARLTRDATQATGRPMRGSMAALIHPVAP